MNLDERSRQALYDEGLSPNALKTYLRLRDLSQRAGYVGHIRDMNSQDIADYVGLRDTTSVSRIMRQLESLGYIKRERAGFGQPWKYLFT